MGWRDLEVLLVHSSFRNLTSLSNIPQSGHLVTSELSQCWGACPLPLLREPTPLLDCSDNQKFPSQWTGLHLLGLSLTLSTHSHGPVENPPDDSGDIGDVGSIPGLERSSRGGHSNPPQYSCLENPMDRGGWRATVHGVPKSRTRLKWRARTHACILSHIHPFTSSSSVSRSTKPEPLFLDATCDSFECTEHVTSSEMPIGKEIS